MRFFSFLICLAFLSNTLYAEEKTQNQMHPDAFIKRSYTPTFAQIIMARSTGRPYVVPQPTSPDVAVEPEHKAIEHEIAPEVAPKTPAPAPKPLTIPFTIPGLHSDILKQIKQYDIYIRHYSRIHDLDPNLVRAVIYVESAGDPDAVSVDGAMGLMQLMPMTAGDMGVRNAHDPAENIFGGTRYLSRLIEQFGSIDLALWAYNAGPEMVKRKKLPQETRQYIPKVIRIQNLLNNEGI